MRKINVTVWNEFRHEIAIEKCKEIYPEGIHTAIGNGLLEECETFNVNYAWLDKDAEHGLSQEVLDNTDVLFWWGHCAHGEVKDEIVDRVQARIQEGMGLIVLHSGHFSKIFRRMLGTTCSLKWREGDRERVWTVEPAHPIAEGIPEYFTIPETEMYGERFDIPTPDKVVFMSWYKGGEVFRSGVTFERGNGRIFYFSPGHETYPIYYDPNVKKILSNAAKWAAPRINKKITCPFFKSLEEEQK